MMPTMQEIDRAKEVLTRYNLPHDMPYIETLYTAARRGVEADEQIAAWKREELEWHDRHDKDRIRLGECESQRDAALQRAEKAEAELAALKVERIALARECIDAWENAVDWSSYASEYFRAKHGADRDQDRLDAARDRLAILELQAEREPALKAAQPQEMPSTADDDATRWRHGEPTQPERVSVPREHLEHLRDDEPIKVELVRKWAKEMLAAAQEGK